MYSSEAVISTFIEIPIRKRGLCAYTVVPVRSEIDKRRIQRGTKVPRRKSALARKRRASDSDDFPSIWAYNKC